MKMLKKMGLYKFENVDNPNICKIAINPKEYFEKFKNRSINKKHKGVRRDTPGISFQSYAKRIKVLREIDSVRSNKKMIHKRLQVKDTKMKMTSVSKVQLVNLNDKRYCFLDGILSLPFGHLLLSDLCELIKSFPNIHTVIEQEKSKLLKLKIKLLQKMKDLEFCKVSISK